jgi:Thiamine pyrophosphate enzyme, N-terminal TPP binding domain
MTSPAFPTLNLFESNQRLAGHLLVECLVAQGVTHAFGVPGESYLAVLDGLHAHREQIAFITCRQRAALPLWPKPWANSRGDLVYAW